MRIYVDDVEMGGPEYGFYLLSNGADNYVLVEVTYLYVASVVPEISHLFPVVVQGWCSPIVSQEEVSPNLLPAMFFNDNYEEQKKQNTFARISFKQGGHIYVFLSVIPK